MCFTSLVQMIWLLVPDLVFFGGAPRLRPPIRSSVIAASIGMCRLFLGLDGLDPSLGDQLAGRLLTIFKALVVELPKCL
jgi:hypothetical protein